MSPRTFPPPPGWSPDGHRIKAPLDYGRGPDKVWVYGALRERDGRAVTLTAPARNTAGYLRLLAAVERANPVGELYLIADNLSSHKSPPIQAWLDARPRVHQVFIPKGACWLNLQEGWWRLWGRRTSAGLATRSYTWCSPPRIGWDRIGPTVERACGIGVSRRNARCGRSVL